MYYNSTNKAKSWDSIHKEYNMPNRYEDGSHLWSLPIQYHNTNDLYQWEFKTPHRIGKH